MHSLYKIFFIATAIFAAVVSSTPAAQEDQAPAANGVVLPIENVVPKSRAHKGKDPGPLPVPKATAEPTPSPRFTAPVKIVENL